MTADDTQIGRDYRDVIVALLWLPPIVILVGLSVAIAALAVRLALYAALPAITGVGAAIDPTLLVVAVVAALAYLYLMLANETFGTDTVESATEQAQDLRDDLSNDE